MAFATDPELYAEIAITDTLEFPLPFGPSELDDLAEKLAVMHGDGTEERVPGVPGLRYRVTGFEIEEHYDCEVCSHFASADIELRCPSAQRLLRISTALLIAPSVGAAGMMRHVARRTERV